MKDLLANFLVNSTINFINTNNIEINHIICSVKYYMPFYEDRTWFIETDICEENKHYQAMLMGHLFKSLEDFNKLFKTNIEEFKINFLLENNKLKEIYNIEIDMRKYPNKNS